MQNRSKLFLILSLTLLSSSIMHANPRLRAIFSRNTSHPNTRCGMPLHSRGFSSQANATDGSKQYGNNYDEEAHADEEASWGAYTAAIFIGMFHFGIVGALTWPYEYELMRNNEALEKELQSEKEYHEYLIHKRNQSK